MEECELLDIIFLDFFAMFLVGSHYEGGSINSSFLSSCLSIEWTTIHLSVNRLVTDGTSMYLGKLFLYGCLIKSFSTVNLLDCRLMIIMI